MLSNNDNKKRSRAPKVIYYFNKKNDFYDFLMICKKIK